MSVPSVFLNDGGFDESEFLFWRGRPMHLRLRWDFEVGYCFDGLYVSLLEIFVAG